MGTAGDLRLLGRYAAGEFGAYRVVGGRGQHFALKLAREQALRRAAETTAALRAFTSYPAPEYVDVAPAGERWCALLTELPGAGMARNVAPYLDQLLALNDLQAGRAFLPDDQRPVMVSPLEGEDGYALHDTMRRHSAATSELLDEIIAIGRRHEGLDYPARDIVHHDFHHGNILVQDGDVSGVVDWEGTRSGDRRLRPGDAAVLLRRR